MNLAAKTTLILGFLVVVACGGSSGQKPATCPTGQHDGGKGVCVAIGACSSGYHDGGDGKCTTLDVCASGYGMAADGSCTRTSACPAGTHDNGAGVCVPTINCPTGYHDGGSGTCVPTGACSGGYHDGGNGECWIEGTCSSGYHNGGTGACVPLVACSANYHDGGDGTCVPDGQCSSGYHDGGDGRCITVDKCSVGYHDGGGGTCTTIVGCLSGYRDNGTGLCVCRPSAMSGLSPAMCPCATGFHDDGAGKCVSTGCATGYHDGGDGTCTWSGSCIAGFSVDGSGACIRTTDAAAGGTGAGGVGAGGIGTGGADVGGAGAGGLGAGGAGVGGAGGLVGGSDAGPTGTGGVLGPDAPIWRDGSPGVGGMQLTGGTLGSGGVGGAGGIGGIGGTGGSVVVSNCGNGVVNPGELCDCGSDSSRLPTGCASVNGIFYGDGKGCSKTCTGEPSCMAAGKTQACTQVCGDGHLNPGEACDDGNLLDGDGCAHDCTVEVGFTCTTATYQDSQTCQSGSGQCIEFPVIYRDFQPENIVSGGHPDFHFLGTKWNGSRSPTTICVPIANGPSQGNDSTARCWGIAAPTLLNGKPQLGTTTSCLCQFSDWNIGDSSRIQGGYTQAGNDSPLSDGSGAYLGGSAGSAVSVTGASGISTGTLTGYTSSSPGGPIWKGTVPMVKDANSFKQWWSNDNTVNKAFSAVLELPSIGTNIYQYASKAHLAQGGFFPLDLLNPSQATLCNLWPYWNHGNGNPIWSTCTGDQYLNSPYVVQSDCASGDTVSDGCWVTNVPGVKHDFFFTSEARYYFVYDGSNGISLSVFGEGDIFVFINGILVLDLGGPAHLLPGKVTVTGSPGDAQVVEGGCLDTAGNITGVTVGSSACSPVNGTRVTATTPDDFRVRTVSLGLVSGATYEIAIFHANRTAPNSNLQITLNGSIAKRSVCTPN